MKVIYIHGWQSSPRPEKVAILEEAGLQVIAPEIDYEKEQGKVYERIKTIALEERVEALIGSSMGGFVAYWLSRELNLPSLLYNPALYFESLKAFIPQLSHPKYPPLFICSGEKDETVMPGLLKEYLAEKHPNDKSLKLISAHWLAHGIDLQTFRSMTAWFLAGLKKS